MSFLESALKKGRVAGVVVLIAGSVAACTHTGTPLDQFGDKTKIGSVIGATGGGLLAAAAGGGASGIAAGVLLGGLTGGVLGNKLDNEDQRLMQRASHRALETGRTGTSTAWRNPDSGHHGASNPPEPTSALMAASAASISRPSSSAVKSSKASAQPAVSPTAPGRRSSGVTTSLGSRRQCQDRRYAARFSQAAAGSLHEQRRLP